MVFRGIKGEIIGCSVQKVMELSLVRCFTYFSQISNFWNCILSPHPTCDPLF